MNQPNEWAQNSQDFENELKNAALLATQVIEQMQKKIVGQSNVSKRLLMALFAQGHVLLEGLPGLAKTTAIKCLSQAADLDFKRVQFTPDLLPADLIGTQIFDPKNSDFKTKKGPIFANLVLADEINRAPAKVQSALLEAMEERQITIGDETFFLEEPFLVMATQNPVEQEGTYTLPEAQLDRFLFKVQVTYSQMDEEIEIIKRAHSQSQIKIEKVISKQQIQNIRKLLNHIYVSDKIRKYIVELVFATREPAKRGFADLAPYIEYGASPRASIALEKTARVNALLEGRGFVTPQDIKDVGFDVLRHRIKTTYEADSLTTEKILQRIFDQVDVP